MVEEDTLIADALAKLEAEDAAAALDTEAAMGSLTGGEGSGCLRRCACSTSSGIRCQRCG